VRNHLYQTNLTKLLTFLELANRVTGFSIPIFGVSWNPPKLERKVAEDVITFLEDRRVLFNPFELEILEHCKQSVIKTREFLTQQLYDIQRGSDLDQRLRAMRAACRKFLDTLSEHEVYFRQNDGRLDNNIGLGGQMLFYSAMGELRGTLGVHIVHLLIMYGIDCEGDLMSVLPLTNPED